MNEIYVTGHRNPDTDSIVAAMSYAALKNALGEKEYVAVHLGTVSDETNRMLERFHFNPPRFIQNVRTQVKDLDFDRPPCLDASVTMDRAWKLMREQKISAIPVVNEDGSLYGLLSAGDIATFSLNTVGEPRVEAIPLFNLLSVIEGRIMGDGQRAASNRRGHPSGSGAVEGLCDRTQGCLCRSQAGSGELRAGSAEKRRQGVRHCRRAQGTETGQRLR